VSPFLSGGLKAYPRQPAMPQSEQMVSKESARPSPSVSVMRVTLGGAKSQSEPSRQTCRAVRGGIGQTFPSDPERRLCRLRADPEVATAGGDGNPPVGYEGGARFCHPRRVERDRGWYRLRGRAEERWQKMRRMRIMVGGFCECICAQ
jgi:hypothetical protein